MKTSDFLAYTGTSKLPYSSRILGIIKPGDSIPDAHYNQGDCYLISPEDVYGDAIVFFDGTQFRYPKGKARAGIGVSSKSDEIQYILENSFGEMFTMEGE